MVNSILCLDETGVFRRRQNYGYFFIISLVQIEEVNQIQFKVIRIYSLQENSYKESLRLILN